MRDVRPTGHPSSSPRPAADGPAAPSAAPAARPGAAASSGPPDATVDRRPVHDSARVALRASLRASLCASLRASVAHAAPQGAARPVRVGRAAAREPVGRLVHLRAVLAEHVGARRADDAPVEQVLREVRALVREAEAAEGASDPSGVLATPVVRWSIGAYFDAPELRHVPRFY